MSSEVYKKKAICLPSVDKCSGDILLNFSILWYNNITLLGELQCFQPSFTGILGTTRQIKLMKKHTAFLLLQGLYMAGGTAAALQLGHRKSEDFDFFSAELHVRRS
ncbi:MAG: hypothetical protein C4554_08170 [Dethiobacter sp.]|nr:MAG: hypothetical protein C4554_08170 [Dethiobacter sp.]